MYDARTNLSKEVADEVRRQFQGCVFYGDTSKRPNL